jgi:hypothetical protein
MRLGADLHRPSCCEPCGSCGLQPGVQSLPLTRPPRRSAALMPPRERGKGPKFDQLRALSADVFDQLPPAFRPDLRNPCWGEGPDLR